MSTFKPQGRRTYVYDFRRGGERFRGNTGATRKREADAIERAEIERVEAELKRRARGEAPRLGDVAAWWWTHHGAQDRDEATTWFRLENLLAGLGETRTIAELDETTLARWVAWRRRQPTRKGTRPAPATVNREIELLRRLLRQSARPLGFPLPAIDWGALRRAEPRARVVEMTAAEEAAFFAALDPVHHPIFEHYLLTGVRLAMAVALRQVDLDLDAGWVTFAAKAAPGAPAATAHTLPITPAMRRIYEAALEGNDTDRVFAYRARRTRTRPGQAPLVRGRAYPYSAAYVDTLWERARARAAESCPSIARLRLHDLRHTFASRFYRQSGDLLATQRALGHSRAETTQKYAHVFDRDLAERLGAWHAAAAPPPIRLVKGKGEGR